MAKQQVLYREDPSRVRHTRFDPASIMMYPINSKVTKNGYSVDWNSELSVTDKQFIAMLYPAPPPAPLSAHHGGCNDISKSRTPDCMAAMHRHCNNKGADFGVSQEVGAGVFGVACASAGWYGNVSVATLKQHHGGCNDINKSQTPDCMSAIHRFCSSQGFSAGISQEVGAGIFGVACFRAGSYRDVSLSLLSSLHGGCNNLGRSQTPDCMAAVHRACQRSGWDFGISQEVGNGVFGVACAKAKWYGDVSLR